MTSWTERRRSMEARLNELTRRLQKIDEELESHNSRDWEELATERESDEVLEDLGLTGQEEIKAIQAAFARMDAGEYGICVSCGEPIGDARLDALPYTPFCRDCARDAAGG